MRQTLHRAPTITDRGSENQGDQTSVVEQFGKPTSNTIPTIIRGYKSAVTKQIKIIRNAPKMVFWQRNYYEHIIRNEEELNRVRKYIIDNPIKWDEDEYNCARSGACRGEKFFAPTN